MYESAANIAEEQFFADTDTSGLPGEIRYRKSSELFSQESLEADVAKLPSPHPHPRFSRPTRISGGS